jgi:putative N6-adenine-specific DNA methylase
VARELHALGEQPQVEDGGVSWIGDLRSVMRANLWLRSASRVVVRIASFRAKEFYELESRAKKIEWDLFLGPGIESEFRVTARKSRLYHSDAIAQRLSAACSRPPATRSRSPADRARPRAESREPRVSESREPGAQLFVVRVVNNEFSISADTSGTLLHMRGYRHETGKAPLRENLAAALLLAVGWSGDTPLVDPFCGSGTIPIEGALLARRMAPGRWRQFAFQHWPRFAQPTWSALLADADAQVRPLDVAIVGSDRDGGAVEAAQANALRAGVPEVCFEQHAVSAAKAPAVTGVLATNPPYGKRVRERHDLRNLYAQFGHTLRSRFPDWTVALYSPESRLDRQLGIQLRREFRTVNGGIPIAAMLGKVAD